jgi:hypothetical protein
MLRNHRLLFLITLGYFALGFVNIHFALLGLVCMALPIVMLVRSGRKSWCQGYCPRASLYSACGRLQNGKGRSTPRFFVHGPMRWIMLAYFGLSLFVIVASTVRVAQGAVPPMTYVRFFLLFPLGKSMPQLIAWAPSVFWVTHLAYRFYSMMLTTTTLGLMMAFLYKPRSWCTVCPIATVSALYLDGQKKSCRAPADIGAV